MFSHFVWNPSRDAFILPFLNHPIAWYGLFFALGFFLALLLFLHMFYRFLLSRPYFTAYDVDRERLLESPLAKTGDLRSSLKTLNQMLHEGSYEAWEIGDRALKFIGAHLPRYRYELAKTRLILEARYPEFFTSLKDKAKIFTESLLVYTLLGTVIGARLGHLLFYEQWGPYLQHPLRIFMIWEGGLASHGGIIGILVALLFFYHRRKTMVPRFHPILLIDFMVVPSAIVSFFIRIGNFVNQEILGTKTALPWGVIFLDPIDGSAPAARHPVQLYEAGFYLFVLAALSLVFYTAFARLRAGILSGAFFIAVFTFRFFIEFFKEKQSALLADGSMLLMGQWLSIPMVLLGVWLLFAGRRVEKI